MGNIVASLADCWIVTVAVPRPNEVG